ncbi:CBS domain-containing protein [Xanthomarina sp. F2636L]|uniref:CBS domain-containing protein n=1 Tax=Xanthomarina sp. F2636L TaxID=2996018 RepID=UPI00225E0769|nr:CBS domain-containing protein [Xanthomarina sp. F2636L]MCX7551281.1 CBS domain-containing protein [Xanthomarina sp. F2636L]
MGNLHVTKLQNKKEHANYIHHLMNDLEALDLMLEGNLIEKEPLRIGAEQEFFIVDKAFFPNNNALDILEDINDAHFTTEIGNFNLEINLDPVELKSDCFSKLEHQLTTLLEKAKQVAKKHDSKILLTGILPTLSLKHITVDNMTPIQRYFVLNDAVKESRNQDFHIHIKGVDELSLIHDSVMLEGCNTSFQMHLQIHPDTFIDSYNWAQAIAGPVLSICTNSPMLFGKELWAETRIALFTQSVDTRANSFLLNENQSRVSFGNNWETGTVTDIFRDNISRFRSLVTSEYITDSVDMIERGEIPKLKALGLHNGTVYRWNRVCYGVGEGKPHLRIENRYIPSGPTTTDEIANMMFWVGLMHGKPANFENIHEKWDFKDVKSNFFSAARYGMGTQFFWDGNYMSSQQLILDHLLPMAYKGLYSVGVDPADVEKYLTIIENRVKSYNGSQWLIKNHRQLSKTKSKFETAQIITSELYEKQEHNYPIGSWNMIKENEIELDRSTFFVKHTMSTDIFSVHKDDSLQLVKNMMTWKKIRHMPVIDETKKLVGLITDTDVKELSKLIIDKGISVEEVMTKDLITISQYDALETAKILMKSHQINCLPVLEKGKLVGLITSKDFIN